MAYSIPQIVLPIETTAPATLRLILANSGALGGPFTVDATLPAGTYWNDRRYSSASNLGNAIATVLEAREIVDGTLGTWVAEEVLTTGTVMRGMTKLVRTAFAGDIVTSLATHTPLVLPRDWIGWATDIVAASSFLFPAPGDYWDAVHMPRGLWIPQPVDSAMLTLDESWPDDVVVVTETPTGESSQDFWGSSTRRSIDVSWIAGASIWPHYLKQSAFAAVIGAQIDDSYAAWDQFRIVWRDLTGTDRQARWSPDYDDPGTYAEVIPRGPWIGSTRGAVTTVTKAPLLYRLQLEMTEV